MQQTSNPDRQVQTRRMQFEEDLAQVPKHFAGGGDIVTSHFWAGLSAMFPDGEDFFVKTVRHYRDQIKDPQLQAEVRAYRETPAGAFVLRLYRAQRYARPAVAAPAGA